MKIGVRPRLTATVVWQHAAQNRDVAGTSRISRAQNEADFGDREDGGRGSICGTDWENAISRRRMSPRRETGPSGRRWKGRGTKPAWNLAQGAVGSIGELESESQKEVPA